MHADMRGYRPASYSRREHRWDGFKINDIDLFVTGNLFIYFFVYSEQTVTRGLRGREYGGDVGNMKV